MLYLHLLKMFGIIAGLVILFTQVLMPMYHDDLEPWWLFKKKKKKLPESTEAEQESSNEVSNETPTKDEM